MLILIILTQFYKEQGVTDKANFLIVFNWSQNEKKLNQRLSLDCSECMMTPHMFENSVITKVGNVDIPRYQDSPPPDCPPRGQS